MGGASTVHNGQAKSGCSQKQTTHYLAKEGDVRQSRQQHHRLEGGREKIRREHKTVRPHPPFESSPA